MTDSIPTSFADEPDYEPDHEDRSPATEPPTGSPGFAAGQPGLKIVPDGNLRATMRFATGSQSMPVRVDHALARRGGALIGGLCSA